MGGTGRPPPHGDDIEGSERTGGPVRSDLVVPAAGRRTQRRQRRVGWVLIGVGALILLAGAWIGVTGLMARSQLRTVKGQLAALRFDVSHGDLAKARTVAADLGRHAHRAHILTTGPAWYAAAALPGGVGDPIDATRGVAAAVDALGATTVPALLDVSKAADPSTFQFKNHRVDISLLINQTPVLDAAVRSASAQSSRVAALPHHTWFGSVDTAVAQLNLVLTKLVGTLTSLDSAAHAAPTMLGYSTPQRYFVAFQNEAESRGTGGLPGAFGILVADHGTVKFTHFGSDDELAGVDSGVSLGADYDRQWGDFEPTTQYLNSDVGPNFPDAAKIWAGMWQAKSGQHVDGALALDPSALSYFLGSSGPAKLPDGSQVTSGNVVALTQSTVYAKYPNDQNARKSYLVHVAEAVDQHVLGAGGSSTTILRAAARAVGERRLLLWQANPAVEATLSAYTLGGAIPKSAAPFVGPVVVNYGANKLDYYLDRSVVWQATGCGATRNVTVTIRLGNKAPASGLPTYVTHRSDDPGYPIKPGDNSLLLYYVGTTGGHLSKLTADGQPVSTSTTKALRFPDGTVAGHPTYTVLIELRSGQSRTIVLHLTEPASSMAPTLLRQPLVRPETISTTAQRCG